MRVLSASIMRHPLLKPLTVSALRAWTTSWCSVGSRIRGIVGYLEEKVIYMG